MKLKGLLSIIPLLLLTCINTEEKSSSMKNKSDLDSHEMLEKREWMVKTQMKAVESKTVWC
ncbi:MAG: hypothetical protein OEV55_00970 [candidate division Zixibacteria bacterium]|nr:hypothetical protein [candidate division Zixibacteria bacterium]